MSDKNREKFVKYTSAQIMSTKRVKFGLIEPGNWFLLGDYLCIRINEPKDRKYSRNTVVMVALDGDEKACGLGLALSDEDLVDVVYDSTVIIKGYLDM